MDFPVGGRNKILSYPFLSFYILSYPVQNFLMHFRPQRSPDPKA